jgi:hypothetical protein
MPCDIGCTGDLGAVIDCKGTIKETCTAGKACDRVTQKCEEPCLATHDDRTSFGCEFYAVDMDLGVPNACFAVYVTNRSNAPAHLSVARSGAPLTVDAFTRLPSGAGAAPKLDPYDAAAGLAPGAVAVMFLAGLQGTDMMNGDAYCPINPAVANNPALSDATGIGDAFQITSDVPVVVTQANPWNAIASVTGASLLLPTGAWDTSYVAIEAFKGDIGKPSIDIIATQDNTKVTLTPNAPVKGGGGVPAGSVGQPLDIVLNKGQFAQITQPQELTGSVLTSDKPVGVLAGNQCMRVPMGNNFCDHGEQMIPPESALGSEHVAVGYRPRIASETTTLYRFVGTADGTVLTYSNNISGPAGLKRGEVAELTADAPFVVASQDAAHPFLMFTYMTGSGTLAMKGQGDPDFVVSVPTRQFLSNYTFNTDLTFPETNLVFVRKKGLDAQFHDVTLDCLGAVTGWQPVGNYEYARVDLTTGDFTSVNGCSTGAHNAKSDGPFELTIWGWGTPVTMISTQNTSYAYPAGMGGY